MRETIEEKRDNFETKLKKLKEKAKNEKKY